MTYVPPKTSVRAALSAGRNSLKRHRCPGADAALEAELLLSEASGLTKEAMFTHPEKTLSSRVLAVYGSLLRRRRAHEPIAYLRGRAWFHGREFRLTPATLIPRPATEHVVDAVLKRLDAWPSAVVADIGTGSGAVAVTIAAERPTVPVLATDLYAPPLAVARRNARRLAPAARIRFRHGDLFSPISRLVDDGRPLVVVANLPYIPSGAWRTLAPDIRLFEPKTALVAGPDGLADYRRLIGQLADLLPRRKAPTALIIEILPRQFRPLVASAKRQLPTARCAPIKNWQGVTVGMEIIIE